MPRQNFKLVPWESIAQSVDPPLTIDTAFDPRMVGGDDTAPSAPEDLVAKYRAVATNEDQAQYFANVSNVDRAVGRLVAALGDEPEKIRGNKNAQIANSRLAHFDHETGRLEMESGSRTT